MNLDHLEQVQKQLVNTQEKVRRLTASYYNKGFNYSKKSALEKSFFHPASMSIYKILSNSLGDSDKLLSYSIGKIDASFLDEASDCVKDHVNANMTLSEISVSRFGLETSEKVVASVVNSYRNGIKDGLQEFIKTATANIASQLIRVAAKSEPMLAVAISYDSINSALTDLIGIEYEVLPKDQKKKLEELYKNAFDMGFRTVTPDIFANKSSLVYQMLKERVDGCPSISDGEFIAKVKAGNSEIIDSMLKASDYNAEDFAFDVYSKVFIDGVYNVKYDPKAYNFVSESIIEFVRSSGYADGIEASVNQIAPKIIANYAISEL